MRGPIPVPPTIQISSSGTLVGIFFSDSYTLLTFDAAADSFLLDSVGFGGLRSILRCAIANAPTAFSGGHNLQVELFQPLQSGRPGRLERAWNALEIWNRMWPVHRVVCKAKVHPMGSPARTALGPNANVSTTMITAGLAKG